MKLNYLVTLCGVLATNVAFAYCPEGLDVEKTAECITIEGSGANYQDWSKQFYGAEIKSADPMVSPITGKDIRTLTPAAGSK